MELNDKIQICKVVAQAILADGQLTDTESEFLADLMNRYELTDEQRKEIMARDIDDDPGALAKQVTDRESQNQLVVELAMAIASDGEFSSSEKQLLNKVAAAMKMDQADLDMLVKTALM